jgi:hypothetical protein
MAKKVKAAAAKLPKKGAKKASGRAKSPFAK